MTRNKPGTPSVRDHYSAGGKNGSSLYLRKCQCQGQLQAFRNQSIDVELHSFGDGSKLRVGAAVYAVVTQGLGTTQRLVAAQESLAKGGLSIPCLELVAGHMATNLLTNVRNALEGLPISNVYGWLDSTVALHWMDTRERRF